MKRIEEYIRTEFGNRWHLHDETTKIGRRKFFGGNLIEVELLWTKHPYYMNLFGKQRTSWVPVSDFREVDIE